MQRLLVLLLGLGLTAASHATDITLTVGVQSNADMELSDGTVVGETGDEVSVDDSTPIGLSVDWNFQREATRRIGLFFTTSSTELGENAALGNPDLTITHLQFTGTSYYPSGNWEPFVTAGIGAAFIDPDDSTLDSDTRFSAMIGAGGNYKFTDNFLLRLEARWLPIFFNGGGAGICSGGCTVAFKSSVYSAFQANIGLQYRF